MAQKVGPVKVQPAPFSDATPPRYQGSLGEPDYVNAPRYTDTKLLDWVIKAFRKHGEDLANNGAKQVESDALTFAGAIKPVNIGSEAENVADFLRRAWPEIESYAKSKVNTYNDTQKAVNLLSNSKLSKVIPENYYNAIQEWLEGNTNNFRKITPYNNTSDSEKIVQNMVDLYNASKNKSVGPLWRATTEKEIGENPAVGQTFFNPFASYTVNPIKAVNWLGKGGSGATLLKLEPGAKTLPLAGVAPSFETELEHLVGGEFKIKNITPTSAGRDILHVEQVNPNPANFANISPSSTLEDASNWAKSGGQLGSNPGAILSDKNGDSWYVKTYQNAEQAKSEILANKIYNLLGIPAPESKLVMKDGKPSVANKWLYGVHNMATPEELSKRQDVLNGFVADALLANHDVVGQNFDNISRAADGRYYRIDNGGSMFFRAQGEPKNVFIQNKYGVPEISTMRDPFVAEQAGQVFKGLGSISINRQIQDIGTKLTNDKLNTLINESGFSKEEAAKYYDYLTSRRNALLTYPKYQY